MANPFPTFVDLDDVARGTGGFKIFGENERDQAGSAVAAAGDFNGDGIADILVGAYRNDGGRPDSDTGAAYVIFGKVGGRSPLFDLDSTIMVLGGFKIQGEAAGDLAGRSASGGGDINADGITDLIVGAHGNDSGGIDAGAAYVVYGATVAPRGVVFLDAVARGSGGFKIQGETARDVVGGAVSAAGDVNGDGIADIVVGSSRNDAAGTDAGAAYVVYGKAGGLGLLVDLDAVALGTGGFKIRGENAFDYAGVAVAAAGDVNGDQIADLLIGATGNDSGGSEAGAAYVVYGQQAARTGVVDLDAIALGSGGFKIQGENSLGDVSGDRAGYTLSAAGDVNGDGLGDIFVGMAGGEYGSSVKGAAYVVYGRSGTRPGVVDLDAVALGTGGFKIQGEALGDLAGGFVCGAGDVNGDGLGDLIVGAPGINSGGFGAGAAYVVFGRASGFSAVVDLAAVAAGTGGFKIQGEQNYNFAGGAVSVAGDVNRDGYDDLAVGAPLEGTGGLSAGAAYIVYGRAETITPQADSAGGTSGTDLVDLLAGDDYYDGKGGNDTITGNAGADFLRGRAGDDVFQLTRTDLVAPVGATVRNTDMKGTNGNLDAKSVAGLPITLDILDGGDGNDTVQGTPLADVVVLSAPGAAVYAGQSQTARIVSVETFNLDGGDDVLSLTTTAAARYATNVTANGGEGNDTLWSGAGNDRLNGGNGNDYLVGGRGTDILDGGAGADLYGFAPGMGTDTIRFAPSEGDRIRIKGFGTGLDSLQELRDAGAITTQSFTLPSGETQSFTAITLGAVGNQTVIQFLGITPEQLTAAMFQFVA